LVEISMGDEALAAIVAVAVFAGGTIGLIL
jgi:hypothetical protein